MKRLIGLVTGIATLALLFTGCLWQIEISIINTCNNWEFGYFFCMVTLDNWVARDIFYCVLFTAFIIGLIAAFYLGVEVHKSLTGKAYANL